MAKTEKLFAVMLIDDNEIDNLINQKMVEAADLCEHIYTHTGARSAIEFLKNIEKLHDVVQKCHPDLIFLDIDMPLMDGFQFLEEFDKMSSRVKGDVKVVMLTSSINPSDVSRSNNFPYVISYLNKPLTQENLENLKKKL